MVTPKTSPIDPDNTLKTILLFLNAQYPSHNVKIAVMAKNISTAINVARFIPLFIAVE